MWVCTSWGVLMPGLRPEGTVTEGDDKVLQVRARRKKDLEILRDKYMKDDLGEIFSLPHTDYEWRAYCTLESWGVALGKIGADIDYVKFKETAEKVYNDHELHSLYLSMWSTIFSHLSTVSHQADYWSSGTGTGLYGSTGKYGTTYPGTGAFSVKKGKRKAGQNHYDYSASGRKQPWWADAEGTDTWWEDSEGLGLGRYSDYIDGDPTLAALRRSHTANDVEDFSSLMDRLVDLDPIEKPVLTATGDIDHSYCDHGPSKSAKKRCRARWRRFAKQHQPREFGSAYSPR